MKNDYAGPAEKRYITITPERGRLLHAIVLNDIANVRKALRDGAQVESSDFVSCIGVDEKIVRALLKHCDEPHLALARAARHGNVELIAVMLDEMKDDRAVRTLRAAFGHIATLEADNSFARAGSLSPAPAVKTISEASERPGPHFRFPQ